MLKNRREHHRRLEKAAGVVVVELRCAPGTWRRVQELCVSNHGPHLTAEASASGDMVQVGLDGPNLVLVLQRMRSADSFVSGAVDRALAHRVYEAVAEVVDRIDLEANEGSRPPSIVLDARIGEE